MPHELENPATTSRAAPATITKSRVEAFEFRQVVLAIKMGFMADAGLQVPRQFLEKMQATHYESFLEILDAAQDPVESCNLHA